MIGFVIPLTETISYLIHWCSALLSTHLEKNSARLRGYSFLSRIESPYIGVDEQECCPIEFACCSEALCSSEIQMSQPACVTSQMRVSYLAIQLLQGIFQVWRT